MSRGFPAVVATAPATVTYAALAIALVTASGCAALSPPERPVYEGRDRVGEVAPDQLVGVWNVTPLNPYPDQPEQTTVIEYRADGSVIGHVESGAGATATMGNLTFEVTGEWTVADGRVSHRNVKMEAMSDSTFAKLMSSMVNGTKRDLGGEADVHELDANRIVMLGTDGAAMEYVRR